MARLALLLFGFCLAATAMADHGRPSEDQLNQQILID
jgi:hypothetical protein